MYRSYRCLSLRNIELLKRFYSVKPAVKKDDDFDEQLKKFERISNISKKVRTKKPQRQPFVKNFLVANVDTELLAYPELEKEDVDILEKDIQYITKFITKPELSDHKTSKSFLKDLANERLIGLQCSALLGGRELNVTQSCRFLEVISQHPLGHSAIVHEQLCTEILNAFGNDSQQRKYLEPLMQGQLLAAFCNIESSDDFEANSAKQSSDGKYWVLNGTRNYVLNGSSADIYLVLAQTEVATGRDLKEPRFTTFLVEREFGGITSTKCKNNDSNVELSNLVFENTLVPAENIIGTVDGSDEIIQSIYPGLRLGTSISLSTISRNLIEKLVAHYLSLSREPLFLYETDAVRSKLAEMTVSLYVMESMMYFTTGLIDSYENQDCEVESLITKVFASEQTLKNSMDCMDLLGAKALDVDNWANQLHREALNCSNLHDNNDNLKIMTALLSLRHAGKQINEVIKKYRNPLFYSAFAFKKLWTRGRQERDDPKLDLNLIYYLHPSCLQAAQCLEYSVLRLQFATEILLTRHGADVIEKHMDLRRLSDALIDTFGMAAAISRASRSYCIGLQNAQYEMDLATAFCYKARQRVRDNVLSIVQLYQLNDASYRHIAKKLFKTKHYFPVHPLSRMF